MCRYHATEVSQFRNPGGDTDPSILHKTPTEFGRH
jgi:hypothetical protein